MTIKKDTNPPTEKFKQFLRFHSELSLLVEKSNIDGYALVVTFLGSAFKTIMANEPTWNDEQILEFCRTCLEGTRKMLNEGENESKHD